MKVVIILVCLFLMVAGAIIGGVLGMMIGIGALAIPGLGPMIAAGTLATALGTMGIGVFLGILVGGLLGALLGLVLHRTNVTE